MDHAARSSEPNLIISSYFLFSIGMHCNHTSHLHTSRTIFTGSFASCRTPPSHCFSDQFDWELVKANKSLHNFRIIWVSLGKSFLYDQIECRSHRYICYHCTHIPFHSRAQTSSIVLFNFTLFLRPWCRFNSLYPILHRHTCSFSWSGYPINRNFFFCLLISTPVVHRTSLYCMGFWMGFLS